MTVHIRTSSSRDARLAKLMLAAPLVGAVAPRALAQQAAPDIETRTLDELHKAALAEGGELMVYGGGDLPNGSAGDREAPSTRASPA